MKSKNSIHTLPLLPSSAFDVSADAYLALDTALIAVYFLLIWFFPFVLSFVVCFKSLIFLFIWFEPVCLQFKHLTYSITKNGIGIELECINSPTLNQKKEKKKNRISHSGSINASLANGIKIHFNTLSVCQPICSICFNYPMP